MNNIDKTDEQVAEEYVARPCTDEHRSPGYRIEYEAYLAGLRMGRQRVRAEELDRAIIRAIRSMKGWGL